MPIDPKILVQRFYDEVRNQANEAVAKEILHVDFKFRGSLGPEKYEPDRFIEYMRSIYTALANYTCVVEHLVSSANEVAARMIFHGQHQADFFGVPATNQTVTSTGTAFFKTDGAQITRLWVLGDIDSGKSQIGARIHSQI